jgi:glycosyltransferase involved in cell wall biosynthesis
MKIGVVTPYFYPAWEYGGTPRAAFELARALAGRGHDVRVLTTGSVTDTKDVEGVDTHYYRNVSPYLAFRHRVFLPLGFRRELRQQLADREVLHIHEFRSTLTVPAGRIAKDLSLPFVISPHGGLRHLGKERLKRVFDSLWGQAILEKAAGVLVLTESEKNDALAFRVPASRIYPLKNSIDPSDYSALPQRGSFRKRWNVHGSKIILFLGRLNRIKGIDLLLQAYASSRTDFKEVQLVLAGPDDGEAVGIPGSASVLTTGFLNQQAKLEALVDSDVVVLPSRSEASPIVLYEALLCSRPVVISSACELPMADPVKYGILQFQSLNVADLRDKLLFALNNVHLSDNATVGREFVVREFSPAVVAAQAERIYEEAVFRGSKLLHA